MNHDRYDRAAFSRDARALHSRPVHPLPSWNGPWSGRIQLTALVFLGWTVIGIFNFVPETLNGFDWPVLVGKLTDAWCWALLTPAILLIDRKWAGADQSIAHVALRYLLLSVPFSIVHTYLTAVIDYPIVQIWWDPFRRPEYAIYFLGGSWQTFSAVAGILQTFKYHGRLLNSRLQLERVQKTLIEARLDALRLQLEPHFLFNALNAISSEISSNQTLARDMIEDLSVLLRSSLDCKESSQINLAQELVLLEHYLSIQTVRFGDRLAIEIDVDPAVLNVKVPSLLLQPLVENAIRHGIEGRMTGGTIIVAAHRTQDLLHIRVLDDGVGLPRNWRSDGPAGIGLRVTRERLEALYPEIGDDVFSIRRRESGGTEVAICIPLQRTEVGSHEAA